jgi:gamma-tubulin complex component 3
MLEQAIRSSNAQFEDPNILSRLDVRLLQNTPGEEGWDVFSLDFHVDVPLNTVITPTALLQYLKLFNFLWRMKRAEVTLAQGWKENMRMSRINWKQLVPTSARTPTSSRPTSAGGTNRLVQEAPPPDPFGGVRSLIHRCHILWSEMTHFIYEMQYYFEFEVLECAWSDLLKSMDSPTLDLDALISSHNRYLNQITTRGLLMGPVLIASSSPVTGFLDRFIRIFGIIQRFKIVHQQLRDYSCSLIEEINCDIKRKHHEEWGVGPDPPLAKKYPRSFGDIVSQINNTKSEFKVTPNITSQFYRDHHFNKKILGISAYRT